MEGNPLALIPAQLSLLAGGPEHWYETPVVAWTLMARVEFDSYDGGLERPKPGYRESESVAMVLGEIAELMRADGVSNLYGVLGPEHPTVPRDA